jgi:hypothetical protein
MPNWCENTIVVRHEDPAMIKRAVSAFDRGEFLNEFVPVPKDLTETISGSYGNTDEQKRHELKEEFNRITHGYANWYDFCVNEWGTKWDVGSADGINDIKDNEAVFYFDSAWAPPIEFYNKLVDMGFEVDAMYHEPGMAFAGHYVNGDDDFYEYGSMSAEQIVEELPEELDEAFSISESVAEYEAEQDEE